MGRLGMVVAAAVAAGAAITGAVVLTGTESSEPGAETRPVPADDAFSIDQHGGPYRIVYRVEDPSGDAGVQTERVWVRSPFESRSETAAGAPPGGEVVSVQIATVDRLRFGGRDDAATVARVPSLAPAAVRVAVILDEAEDAGLVETGGQRVVADRRCQVYRSGAPLGSGPLEAITDDDHADSCVDEDGLVLEETLVVDGEVVVRRVAVEVELGDVDDELFEPGEISAAVEQGGGAATPADPGSAPEGPFQRLPADEVPAGFELQGRFSVIPRSRSGSATRCSAIRSSPGWPTCTPTEAGTRSSSTRAGRSAGSTPSPPSPPPRSCATRRSAGASCS